MSVGTEFELDEPVCPTCGEDDFSSMHALKTHHSMKHDDKLPNLVCQECESKFYNRTPRKFCDDCLNDSYECPECGEVFARIRRRNIHHKNKHGESISTTTTVCNDCQNKISYNRDRDDVECECGNLIDLDKEYQASEKTPEGCPNCGDEFVNMGQHWKSSNCEYPDLSDYQKDLLRGILMSDASIQFDDNNRLIIKMTTKKFLEWFVTQLSEICHDKYPVLYQSSEEAKESTKKSLGVDAVDADSEYKKKYQVLTRSHPFINNFDDWYVPEKRFPLDELELTPTVAKMWYCGDGNLDDSKGYAGIRCSNEADRIDEVADLIREKGFDVNTTTNGMIRVASSDTPAFLDWMGEAPPDFDYKWL
jgi:hypothetical protein